MTQKFVSLAWMLGKVGVTAPIIGTTKTAHIADAVGAVSVQLTAVEVEAIEAPYQIRPVLGHS